MSRRKHIASGPAASLRRRTPARPRRIGRPQPPACSRAAEFATAAEGAELSPDKSDSSASELAVLVVLAVAALMTGVVWVGGLAAYASTAMWRVLGLLDQGDPELTLRMIFGM